MPNDEWFAQNEHFKLLKVKASAIFMLMWPYTKPLLWFAWQRSIHLLFQQKASVESLNFKSLCQTMPHPWSKKSKGLTFKFMFSIHSWYWKGKKKNPFNSEEIIWLVSGNWHFAKNYVVNVQQCRKADFVLTSPLIIFCLSCFLMTLSNIQLLHYLWGYFFEDNFSSSYPFSSFKVTL